MKLILEGTDLLQNNLALKKSCDNMTITLDVAFPIGSQLKEQDTLLGFFEEKADLSHIKEQKQAVASQGSHLVLYLEQSESMFGRKRRTIFYVTSTRCLSYQRVWIGHENSEFGS